MAPTRAARLRHLDPAALDPTGDATLLQQYAATGDRDALAALVHRHGPLVYRVCRRLLRPDDVEDVFQATFLVLARRAGAVRRAESVGSWLVGVAGRVAREVRRAERRREVPLVGEVAVETGADQGGLERVEHVRLLHEELCQLPDRLRGPLVACLLQGHTSDEAAAELGSSPRTVRRRVEQAKRVLRARLERRGVAPAVAVALVADVDGVTAGVPAGLVHRTAEVLNDYLAGGMSPPVVLSQGVAKAMTPRKVLSLVAAAAVYLTALGVGLAGSEPPSPPQTVDTPLPAVPPKGAGPAEVTPPAKPGFGVTRAVAAEAEFLRKHVTRTWTGEDRPSRWKLSVTAAVVGDPVPPPSADEIRILYRPGATPASNTELEFKDGQMTRAWVNVSGPLDQVLDRLLAKEMTRLVLAEHLGRPLPWWFEEALKPTSDGLVMVRADARCRAALAEGKCLRLSALLGLTRTPPDAEVAAAQAHTVLKYLMTEARVEREKLEDGRRGKVFFEFLARGQAEGWDAAAKSYGFADTAALEAAWLRWMNTPESSARPVVPSGVVFRYGPPVVTVPPTIPPTRVRDQ
ncbi:RNA polymerase sigma factor [bacterium]|nr:RNA polymerase sigma factor [bacterium]